MKTILLSTLPALLFAGSVLLFYCFYIRVWVIWIIRKVREKESQKMLTKRFAVVLHIVAVLGILCILYAYFIEPYWLEVNIIPIETEKLTSTSFRIVHITDTHCEKKVRLEKKLPDIINHLKPDIIVFTGDSLNHENGLKLFQTTMQKLHAQVGKFAVSGNWDHWYSSNLKLFKNTDFEELRQHTNTVEKNGESIEITGLAFENRKHCKDVFANLQSERFNLLLYHNSDLMDHITGVPVDLYLCGHTHGGQVALPFYGALVTMSKHGKKYEAGLYHQGPTQLYVNRGIGMEGGKAPRVRFFARPEVAVFDIHPIPEKMK